VPAECDVTFRPVVSVNFYELIGDGGLPQGRAVFEDMMVQLLKVKHPGVSGLQANPGDWGIDAFVGDLEGSIAVWQSKFFIEGFGDAQRAQVRESFKAAVDASKQNGHQIEAWTLCTPVDPDPPTAKWWASWKRRQELATKIVIDLWSATEISSMLIAPESASVFRHYFPKSAQAAAPSPIKLRPLADAATYEQSLFVRQLREAGITQNRSAKQAFFNYELLSREVADKGVPAELDALVGAQVETHMLWENRFVNSAAEPGTGLLPGLHGDVMRALETHHVQAPPGALGMSVVHRVGGMHQIVEDGEAGWVAHFRQIAETHGDT
jgi:hypothetical protein